MKRNFFFFKNIYIYIYFVFLIKIIYKIIGIKNIAVLIDSKDFIKLIELLNV